MNSKFCVVMTTFSDESVGKTLINTLIEKRLAACIQVKEVQSYYHWQNKVCCDTEKQLLIKTRRDLFDELKAEIEGIHDYDVPEIICLPITDGSQAYLDWINQECKKSQ